MTDYFAYNGEDVIPTYMPGVPSYGQEGSEGNTGDKGPSVYYTSYMLSSEEDLAECNVKIAKNKLLSNNLDEDGYNEYMEGDLVIDSVGNIYKIESIKDVLMISPYADIHDSATLSGEIFANFSCNVITSFIKNSMLSSKLENPYYSTSEISSFKLYHSRNLDKNIYGNWIRFSIQEVGNTDDEFLYCFNLVLPNGEVLSKTTNDHETIMFVDNRYFYGYFGCGDENIINDDEARKYFGRDIYDRIGDKTVEELINYSSFKENNEDNEYVSILISYYIHKYCSAYVEIRNITTKKIYRYDLSNISFGIDTNTGELIPSEGTYINPYISPVHWDYTLDSSSYYIIPNPDKIEDENTITYTRTFKNYIVYPSRINSDPDYIESAYYNFIQDFFFIDKRALTLPDGYNSYEEYCDDIYNKTGYNEDYTSYPGTPLCQWIQNGILDKSSTLKVKFSNVSKFSLNIRFNKFKNYKTQSIDLPHTAIYVGYPNVELWQQGDAEGNVYLDHSAVIKTDTEGTGKVPDGSTGIYYIYKIIPYGMKINDGTDTASIADAGFSIISIDLSSFDIDLKEENYIQIGLMMFGDNENYEHRPAVFPMNSSEVTDEDDWRDMLFNTSEEIEGRKALNGESENVCYSFKEEYIPREDSIADNNAYSAGTNNTEVDAGMADVTLFINNIVEYNEAEESSENEFETSLEINQLIDYSAHGMKWDASTYTVYKKQPEQE